jgi:uncharacterized membrane protein SirB2
LRAAVDAASYLIIQSLHVGCAALSVSGFAARGALMLADSPLLQNRFVRVAPHVVDTVLLLSAVWLAWALGQVPFVHGWITAKVLALLAYIFLGSFALRRGRTKAVRAAAFVGALATAGYIVSVAVTRDPRGPLAWIAS